MVGPHRPGKRFKEDELESFFDGQTGRDGSYLKVNLKEGTSFSSRGWPWIQAGIRSVIGQGKVEKANILRDGTLLIKTKNKAQTDKFVKVTEILGVKCEVKRDEKLNVSRGTIHAYDLTDLSEAEVVQWLSEFGVTHAKRFTRKVRGTRREENTPTLLLTFDKPSCPTKIELDYTTYHVKKYVPNPLICYQCGKFGHPSASCGNDPKCLKCGEDKHSSETECEEKCLNCAQLGHSCLSRQCEMWQKEKAICTLKVEREIPFGQARKIYENLHHPPVLQGYADAVRMHSPSQQNKPETPDRMEKLEQRMNEMSNLLAQMAKQLDSVTKAMTKDDDQNDTRSVPVSEKEKPMHDKDEAAQGCESTGTKEQRKERGRPPNKVGVGKKPATKNAGKTKEKEGTTGRMDTDDVNDGAEPSQIVGKHRPERAASVSGSVTRRSWTE